MHERERWRAIVDLVRAQGMVQARDLGALTGASAATLRRDLTRLHEMGLVRRVHGGAEALDAGAPRPPAVADGRSDLERQRKRAIARLAADLCRDGESIVINGGTTTFGMVEFLRERRLQIFTNSFAIAEALMRTSENRIILPGGEIFRDQSIILSPFDEDSIQHYTASKMFMSAMSVGPLGLVEGDPLIARAESKLLNRATDLIALADSTKFEARGSMAVAPLARIKILITDEGAPVSALDMLRDAGIAVFVAPDTQV
jgi:DeoR family ulaG and ulaABCDEF operon transcriptional repressor